VVSIQEGSFDAKTSYIDGSANVVEGSIPGISNCGSSPALDVHSTQHSGTVTEGTGATGCTIAFPFSQITPRCVVSSPNGAVFTSYSTTTGTLTINNPPFAKNNNKFTWICDR
jgi:hypothetical protein